jgi:hypothetical protein
MSKKALYIRVIRENKGVAIKERYKVCEQVETESKNGERDI